MHLISEGGSGSATLAALLPNPNVLGWSVRNGFHRTPRMFVAILEAVIIRDQDRLGLQSESEHVDVNIRKPCKITCGLCADLCLSTGVYGHCSPLKVSRIHQKRTSMAQLLKFRPLGMGTHTTRQLRRRPVEQRCCVQHPYHEQMNRMSPMKPPLTPIFMKGSRQGTP